MPISAQLDFDAPVLLFRGFGLAYGDRTILRAIDLTIGREGMFVLLGPVAAGKSSLLRFLADEPQASDTASGGDGRHVWGQAHYRGAPVGERGRPALVRQKARFLMGSVFERIADALPHRERRTRAEQRQTSIDALRHLGLDALSVRLDEPVLKLATVEQRCLSIAGTWVSEEPLLLIDEPTAGLDEPDRLLVRSLLLRIAEERAVLVVTHHLGDVRALGGQIGLIAGGVLQESGATEWFLKQPRSAAGQQFLETGSCAVPSPDAVAEELDPYAESTRGGAETEAQPSPEPAALAPLAAPGMLAAMRWVIPTRLVGVPRPGLLRDLEGDLAALASEGISVLVCLEEQRPIDDDTLQRFGILPEWMPIVDMKAPEIAETEAMCARIHAHLEAGRRVAVHCKGGLGRTGTLLTAYFIWQGAPQPEALSKVRCVEPKFVQSTEQLDFLRQLWHLRQPRSRRPA